MGALRPWARFPLLVVAHLLALGIGAAVFQALEGPPARQLQAKLRAELATFQAEYGACLPPGALEELLGTALAAQVHGVSSLGNGSEAGNWDLPSALLFTASLLTTTGKAARRPGRRGRQGDLGGIWHPAPPGQAQEVSTWCLHPRVSRWCLLSLAEPPVPSWAAQVSPLTSRMGQGL